MTSKQLFVLAVTAIMGAMARELVTGILAIAKRRMPTEAIKQTGRKVFNKTVRSFLLEFFCLGVCILYLILFLRGHEPPKRSEIMQMVFFAFSAIVFTVVILGRFMWLRLKATRAALAALQHQHD